MITQAEMRQLCRFLLTVGLSAIFSSCYYDEVSNVPTRRPCPEDGPEWEYLNAVTKHVGGRKSPGLMSAVNHLWPLGKEEALSELHKYCQLDNESFSRCMNVGLVLRTLFEFEWPRRHPGFQVSLGSYGTLRRSAEIWPNRTFPVIIQDDWPFLIYTGISHFGGPPNCTAELIYYEKYARIRKKPLQPSKSPRLAADKIKALPAFRSLSPQDYELACEDIDIQAYAFEQTDWKTAE